MDDRILLIALHETPGIGWKTIRRIVDSMQDLKELPHIPSDDWAAFGIAPAKIVSVHNSFLASLQRERVQRYRTLGVRAMTAWDDDYPELLKHIAQPPWVLYLKGDAARMSRPCIGMVGTRNPTVYGKKVAEQLAESLSASGACVVSGLARGIDTSAHVGALRASGGGGGTIGVLGCGIDGIYPPENRSLFHRIEESGLLVSEYPPQTPSLPGLFPQRNRIIAGLSLGVAVIEAAERSGSLITADQALDACRDVFAVPGPITSPKSAGTLALIKNGAKLITCAEDILEEYRHRMTFGETTYINDNSRQECLSDDERTIASFLSAEPVTFDELLALSQFNFGHLHSVLLSLLLKKRIEQLPGSAYIII
ncbi:DNA-processing protein DprA [Paenibacillus hamazuiensis]|uniref:DNA-processing protein DprA n=1 Tax=Paenibacillus hamazuiensis TaxID=2936508 RepID=UPI00200F92AF|nr:DNA-processing protein DprA [Paenibacillus hamazuiensis]